MKNPILEGLAGELRPPDSRPIHQWAAENVQLVGGKGAFFDPDASASQRFALDWIQDDDTRQINLVWGTGTGKSVIFEVWIAHIVGESPRDCQFSHQTDRPAEKWVEKRVRPTLENCRVTAPIMAATHRHKKRKLLFDLPNGMTLNFGGANMRNLQDLSVEVVGGQEVWDWDPGRIAEAKARTHDRAGEKMVFCGQGGRVGSDFEREALDGRQYSTGFTCPKCGALAAYFPVTDDPRADFLASFDYDEALASRPEIPWARLLREMRFVTPCCGARYRDTPNNRRRLAMGAALIDHGNEGVPGVVTHTMSAAAAHWIPWSKLVVEFVKARRAEAAGDQFDMRAFVQKRLARFWAERPATLQINLAIGESYRKADFFPVDGEEIPRWSQEAHRIMGVDKQIDHYWAIIRAWRVDGDSRLLWEGRVESVELVRELQKRYGVPNENVGVDCGYEPEMVAKARWKYRDEIRRNGKQVGWRCWVMLKGARADSYPHHERRGAQTHTVRKLFAPTVSAKTPDGTPYVFVSYSNLAAKDALAALMAPDSPKEFGHPQDVSKDYQAQITSEAKLPVSAETWRWLKVGKSGRPDPKVPNHLLDCEVMGVVVAAMRGILQAEKS